MPTHIRFSLLLLIVGVALFGLVPIYVKMAVPILWSGGSFVVVGAAYGFLQPGVFGKNDKGRQHPLNQILLAPFLLYAWSVWHLGRLLSREDICNEVAPGLWIGRRPLLGEIPKGVEWIIDLTAEFSKPMVYPTNLRYTTLPTLDHTVPDPVISERLASEIANYPGGVYVHCAVGHGRSATLIIRALVAKGICPDARGALDFVLQKRPFVNLSKEQELSCIG